MKPVGAQSNAWGTAPYRANRPTHHPFELPAVAAKHIDRSISDLEKLAGVGADLLAGHLHADVRPDLGGIETQGSRLVVRRCVDTRTRRGQFVNVALFRPNITVDRFPGREPDVPNFRAELGTRLRKDGPVPSRNGSSQIHEGHEAGTG
jgi:hypothetical protein